MSKNMNKSTLLFIFSGIVVMGFVFLVVLFSINGLQSENKSLKERCSANINTATLHNIPYLGRCDEYIKIIKQDNLSASTEGTCMVNARNGSLSDFVWIRCFDYEKFNKIIPQRDLYADQPSISK